MIWAYRNHGAGRPFYSFRDPRKEIMFVQSRFCAAGAPQCYRLETGLSPLDCCAGTGRRWRCHSNRGQTMTRTPRPVHCGINALLGIAIAAFICPALGAGSDADAKPSTEPLKIYFVDVEGGQATLFVTPERQSLLVDTGWAGNNNRDADRIVAAAKKAGLNKIDYVLITHFHEDHAGGAPQLAAKISIGAFIDHGENREPADAATVERWRAYQQLLATGKYKRIVAKPGDVLPLRGLRATVVTADGATISEPLPGGGEENALCKGAEPFPEDQTENRRSLGTVIQFGALRIVDLGDLTRDEETKLVCPRNLLGQVDIYIVSHHGWDQSNSAVFLNAIGPRVAVMDNGASKGGTPSAWDIIKHSPRLEDLWQLHYSNAGGEAHNVPAEFIANPPGPDAGYGLEILAWPDGRFEMINDRTHRAKTYAPQAAPIH